MSLAMSILCRMVALMVAIVSSSGAHAVKKQWERLTQCRYVPANYNDGDSFRVNCGGREFVIRLYYIDAPESDLTNGARVGEQRAYFGVTIEDILANGRKATSRVRELLRQRFDVSTRWAVGGGRSREPRFYGLVEVSGKPLVEVLLTEGLARTKGVAVNLPTGEKSWMYRERLYDLERHARDQKKGIWARSKE